MGADDGDRRHPNDILERKPHHIVFKDTSNAELAEFKWDRNKQEGPRYRWHRHHYRFGCGTGLTVVWWHINWTTDCSWPDCHTAIKTMTVQHYVLILHGCDHVETDRGQWVVKSSWFNFMHSNVVQNVVNSLQDPRNSWTRQWSLWIARWWMSCPCSDPFAKLNPR